MRKPWKSVAIGVVLGLIVALFPLGTAFAALSSISDVLSDPEVGQTSMHTVKFTTSASGALGGGDTIAVTLDDDFTVPDGKHFGMRVEAAGIAIPGTSLTNGTLGEVVFTLDAGSSVPASSEVIMTIGGESRPTNPSAAGDYIVEVKTTGDDPGGTCAVSVVADVSGTPGVTGELPSAIGATPWRNLAWERSL